MRLKESKDLAELVGIYLCAGRIHNDTLIISIQKERESYIDHVCKLIRNIFGTSPEKLERRDFVDLIISGRELIISFEACLK